MHAIMHKEMQAQNMEIVVDDEPPTPGTGVMATAAAAAVAAVGGKRYFLFSTCVCAKLGVRAIRSLRMVRSLLRENLTLVYISPLLLL
jgi:hypothetical protein